MFAVHTRKFTDLTDNSETMSKDRGEVCGEETLERFSDQGENTLRIKTRGESQEQQSFVQYRYTLLHEGHTEHP